MHVLSFLAPEDLAKSAQVSKSWRACVDDEQLWRLFNLLRFGKCKKPDSMEWKQFVISNLLHERTLTDNILINPLFIYYLFTHLFLNNNTYDEIVVGIRKWS